MAAKPDAIESGSSKSQENSSALTAPRRASHRFKDHVKGGDNAIFIGNRVIVPGALAAAISDAHDAFCNYRDDQLSNSADGDRSEIWRSLKRANDNLEDRWASFEQLAEQSSAFVHSDLHGFETKLNQWRRDHENALRAARDLNRSCTAESPEIRIQAELGKEEVIRDSFAVLREVANELIDEAVAMEDRLARTTVRRPSASIERPTPESKPESSPIPAKVEKSSAEPLAQNIFKRRGNIWDLRYLGQPETPIGIGNFVGIERMYLLLVIQGEEIFAPDLVAGTPGHSDLQAAGPECAQGMSSNWVSDRQGLRGYMEALDDTVNDLAEAKQRDDLAEVERLCEERTLLFEQVREFTRGLPSRLRDPEGEKARKAASASITDALSKIRPHLAALADHLDLYIRRGRFLSYSPPEEIRWDL